MVLFHRKWPIINNTSSYQGVPRRNTDVSWVQVLWKCSLGSINTSANSELFNSNVEKHMTRSAKSKLKIQVVDTNYMMGCSTCCPSVQWLEIMQIVGTLSHTKWRRSRILQRIFFQLTISLRNRIPTYACSSHDTRMVLQKYPGQKWRGSRHIYSIEVWLPMWRLLRWLYYSKRW